MITGYNNDGSVNLDDSNYSAMYVPDTQWNLKSHDAARHGTNLIQSILLNKRFTFPKSLYAVHYTIRFFVAKKPNVLIVDFFAGSGTTLHAVNLLNAEDNGKRRCIMVTNNEVSVDEAKTLSSQGYKPGDDEWEKYGIARYVTWPRTLCSIKGQDINGYCQVIVGKIYLYFFTYKLLIKFIGSSRIYSTVLLTMSLQYHEFWHQRQHPSEQVAGLCKDGDAWVGSLSWHILIVKRLSRHKR